MVGFALTQVCYFRIFDHIAIIDVMAALKERQNSRKFGLYFSCLCDQSGTVSLCCSYHRRAKGVDVGRLQIHSEILYTLKEIYNFTFSAR
jgi:hypothetical protein